MLKDQCEEVNVIGEEKFSWKDHVRVTRVILKRKKQSVPVNRFCISWPSFNLQSRRSMFRFGYAGLTLNERSKVKSIHTRRFPAHDFLHVGFTSQTSRTNNKRVIELLSLAMLVWPWRRGPRSNRTTPKDSQPMISYMLVYHPKPLGPIISEL